MLIRTRISWCDFAGGDLNFIIRGANCPISVGCENCYVARDFKRWGKQIPPKSTFYPEKLERLRRAKFSENGQPFRRGIGSRPILFPVDYGDIFHRDVFDQVHPHALEIMCERDDADWVLLTKRPSMMRVAAGMIGGFPANLWAMVTAENQNWANVRIKSLLQVPAVVRGVSMEPMLGPISLEEALCTCGGDHRCECGHAHWCSASPHKDKDVPSIHWVIVGGESGPHRRPFKPQWGQSVLKECRRMGIAFFYKQEGFSRPGHNPYLDGVKYQEWPR